MKRILSIAILSCSFCLSVLAQCTPDPTITTPGLYPPPDSLSCVERGVAYSQVVQIRIPATFQGFNIDSIIINGITGFPTGITYACNPATCKLVPSATGCILLSGTTSDPAGDYDLVLNATAYALGFGLPVPDSLLAQNGYDLRLLIIEQGAGCRTGVAVAISGNPTICSGGSTTLTADVTNATGTPSYSWSPNGETTQSITASAAGTYSVTVTDQSGSATASVNVIASQAPVAGFTFQVFGQNAVFTNTSTGNPETYSWDFGDGQTSSQMNPSHPYANTGTYTVTLSVSNDCGSDNISQQVTISSLSPCIPDTVTRAPGVYPSPDSIPCVERGMPFDFTMQTQNYSSLFGVVTLNWTRIDSIENLPCGITWASDKPQYSSGEKGCIRVSGISREVVGHYPLKIYMTFNISALGQTLEQGGEVTSLIDQLNALASGLNLGTLDVDLKYVSRVIEAGDNCPARDTTSTLTASGDACPAFSVDIDGNAVICSGQPTTLTAVPKYYAGNLSSVTYSWTGGETTPSITVSNTGTYTVTVTELGGATVSNSISVTAGTVPTAAFTASVNGAVATITLNSSTGGATNYTWNWGDGTSSSGQIPPPHTYTSNGNFTITLTATNSCGSDQATQTVTIMGVFIKPVENNLEFEVYPNPGTGHFNISIANNEGRQLSLRIFDLSGKMVYSENIGEGSYVVKQQLDLSALPKGVYTLHLNSEAGNGIQRLTVY